LFSPVLEHDVGPSSSSFRSETDDPFGIEVGHSLVIADFAIRFDDTPRPPSAIDDILPPKWYWQPRKHAALPVFGALTGRRSLREAVASGTYDLS
jgi:hypothetical protein